MSQAQQLSTVIREAIWAELSGKLNTAIPGIVNKYDPSGPKVEVTPAIKKVYLDGTVLSFRPIVEVPVIFPRTNRFHLSYPIERGDTGLILFSQRSLEDWLTGAGAEVQPSDPGKFSLTDAMFLPGLFSFKKGNQILSGDNFELVFDDVKIVSNGRSFELTGDLTVNGKVTASGEVTANGLAISEHVHGVDLPPLTPNGTLLSPAGAVTGVTAAPSNPLV